MKKLGIKDPWNLIKVVVANNNLNSQQDNDKNEYIVIIGVDMGVHK